MLRSGLKESLETEMVSSSAEQPFESKLSRTLTIVPLWMEYSFGISLPVVRAGRSLPHLPNLKQQKGKISSQLQTLQSIKEWAAATVHMGMGQNPIPLVNIKIAGKWMFIPLKMVCIGLGIDP